jgi:CBS domain-containing protein
MTRITRAAGSSREDVVTQVIALRCPGGSNASVQSARGRRETDMRIQHLYRREVDVARPQETVQVAAQRMAQREVGTLVVVDAHSRPVGIVTDRDVVTRVVAPRRDPAETTVEDVMTIRPTTVTKDGAAEAALTLMADGGFRRLPVVGADGTLAGVVSLDDVVRALAAEMGRVSRVLATQTPDRVARS